ncbi:amino acid adenylation protein [Streptomyces griseocarneus]|nr:amino acid adenylation protein [Streptomyces griseocarneus]
MSTLHDSGTGSTDNGGTRTAHANSPTRLPDPLARFRQTVADAPGRLAVVDGTARVDFAELDRRTALVAARLRARGVAPGHRVGVSLPRSAGLLVALLAVWRAGAAYVPLDPAHPQDRLASMVKQAGVRIVLTDPEAGTAWPAGVETLSLNDADAWRSTAEGLAGFIGVAPADPAYVIFTSGSTGTPKGVQTTRGGVASLITGLELAGAYDTNPRVVAWNASISFDASVQQWARVCRGDTIVIVGETERTDPARLRELLDTHAVDDLDLTPSHWEFLRDSLLTPTADGRILRLFMGGEPVPPATWQELAAARRRGELEAVNLYGPTECTVDATTAWIEGDAPHIGRPLPGVVARVLGEDLTELPDGTEGELYLSGPGLAHGYVGRAALTAQRFVADPSARGERMYRTGDKVRRLPDGTLAYLGRTDRQIKIRGYRVEPGEIEHTLTGHPDIRSATVTVHHDAEAGDRLVAYYVPADGASPGPDALREHLAAALPPYMVPTAYVPLDAMPLTVNGKTDLAALPEPLDAVLPDGHIAPEGEAETLIAEVWAEVLGRERVGADDDFFALGGHSLLALRVVARLKKRMGVTMRVKDVYQHPSLRALAHHVGTLTG